MKRRALLIVLPLVFCGFICLFYRNECTNLQVLLSNVTPWNLGTVKELIQHHLPLNSFIIYNLPEALWIFSLTILSHGLSIKWKGLTFPFWIVPGAYILIAEYFQFIGFTDGTFDPLDIITAIFLWMIALRLSAFEFNRYSFSMGKRMKYGLYCLVLCSVYLADQWA